MPPLGATAAYRPCPADFRETFIRVGWEGIEDACRANKRTVLRWIEESGGDDLRQARRDYLEQFYGGRVPGRRPLLKSNAAKYVVGVRVKRGVVE